MKLYITDGEDRIAEGLNHVELLGLEDPGDLKLLVRWIHRGVSSVYADPELQSLRREALDVVSQWKGSRCWPLVRQRYDGSDTEARARRLVKERDTLAEQVARGIQLTMSRTAGDREVARGVDFIHSIVADNDLDEGEALRLFCLGLYNRNEFLWVD